MNRNQAISKQTQDKVKLAKQFIQSKYKAIIQRQQDQRLGWKKIIKALAQTPLPQAQKQAMADRAVRQSYNTRQLRVRDRLDNYQLKSMIGKGAFGQVRLARSKQTGQIVAIKRMQKSKLLGKKQIANVFLERQCLARSRSKWLVELKSAFQDKEYLYIAMEWVPGGDLLRLLILKDVFSEAETRFYVGELILAIQQMHKIHYIHRDIKPDNILIARDGHLKLTDFGLSKQLQITAMTSPKRQKERSQQLSRGARPSLKQLQARKQRQFSKVGTPDYIAPQVLTEVSYDHRVDIWSVGVIMFQCLFGYPPFSCEDSKEVCKRVINYEDYLLFPDTPKVSLEAKLLILGMLSPREHRLSIAQIKAQPFFAGFNWEKVTEMQPPFVPRMEHQFDTNNFDSFEQEQSWKYPDAGLCQRDTHVRRSSSLGFQYNFAGFDWQPAYKHDIFARTIKQIESLQRKKTSQTPHLKRLRTQQTQPAPMNKTRQFCKGRNSVKTFDKVKRTDRAVIVQKGGLKSKIMKTDI